MSLNKPLLSFGCKKYRDSGLEKVLYHPVGSMPKTPDKARQTEANVEFPGPCLKCIIVKELNQHRDMAIRSSFQLTAKWYTFVNTGGGGGCHQIPPATPRRTFSGIRQFSGKGEPG